MSLSMILDNGILELSISGSLGGRAETSDLFTPPLNIYENLISLLERARDDDQVRGIYVSLNSYGGSIYGLRQAMQTLASTAKIKPVVVHSTTLCSAAYFLAAGATKIIMSEGGQVGSVGAMTYLQDSTGAQQQEGMIYTVVRATQSIDKNYYSGVEPITPQIVDKTRQEIDIYLAELMPLISEYRPNMASTANQWGTGNNYVTSRAVSIGMIDGVGTEGMAKSMLVSLTSTDSSLSMTQQLIPDLPAVDMQDPQQELIAAAETVAPPVEAPEKKRRKVEADACESSATAALQAELALLRSQLAGIQAALQAEREAHAATEQQCKDLLLSVAASVAEVTPAQMDIYNSVPVAKLLPLVAELRSSLQAKIQASASQQQRGIPIVQNVVAADTKPAYSRSWDDIKARQEAANKERFRLTSRGAI